MAVEQCFGPVCFFPLDAAGAKFFGFSEFLAGLALMVLAWTLADVRYKFRVRTAPLPLQAITFWMVVAIGVLTLLTDLWRAEQWLVPRGYLLTPATWQALLGGLFLLTFLTWAWFAFIKPPRFGRGNAKRFGDVLYSVIIKGAPDELPVVADELSRSGKSLVRFATNRLERNMQPASGNARDVPLVEAYANDLLLMIADQRFCRVIAASSPATAWAIFSAMNTSKRYGVQVGPFARNVVAQALDNKDSFIFHETDSYTSGLIGHVKPLTQALFANYPLVESVGTLLDGEPLASRNWDQDQWRAYCRITLITFAAYVANPTQEHSFVLTRATSRIERAVMELYTLNGTATQWDHDLLGRLGAVVQFIKDAVEILNGKGVPKYLRRRLRGNDRGSSLYDRLAEMIFEVIFAASTVRMPQSLCHTVQYNAVWGDLFSFGSLETAAGRVVAMKARRLLYAEIVGMDRFPNFKGAKVLGFCLNVMGLSVGSGTHDRMNRPLHKAVLAWTTRKFVWLHHTNPFVAEECLVEGITYEPEGPRLVRTYPVQNLRREAKRIVLSLDPVAPPAAATGAGEQAVL